MFFNEDALKFSPPASVQVWTNPPPTGIEVPCNQGGKSSSEDPNYENDENLSL